ncbi:heparinase II/III family protein [Dongia sedimenti]|uniref:Heparinase II/III family protein n=1 Tax=Dongia sedimenti TaxID=3064282 RepID=A0ABU0YMW8_9PROT|nr:heparinase II/III family protein [Rhodospirillaceae bacterium R-7]
MADGITRDPVSEQNNVEHAVPPRAGGRHGSRPGNQRPHLVWPRLQMLFAEPASLLISRARRKLLQPLYRSGPYRLSLGRVGPGDFLTPFDVAPFATPWPADSQAGQALLSGEFRFSGETIREPRPLSRPSGATTAWREGLDRFDWLNDLRAAGAPGAQAAAVELTRRWLGENLRYREDSWRGDILAARLRNLLLNSGYLSNGGDAGFKALLMGSLYRQAAHLGRALPDGLYGAALLEAVIALMLAGLMLPRGERLLVKGRKIFGRELPRQLLADGGHVERSPQAMLDLLMQLIDLRDVFTAARRPLPDSLQISIETMASVVLMLAHGDGQLARFNDTAERDPRLVEAALRRAGGRLRPLNQLPLTGFQRMECARTLVLVDCGAPPRHGLDAHAHAGTLAFEMSVDGDHLIVNCGAHPWSKEWQQVQRTSAAHSTLIVDNVNSSMLLPPRKAIGGGVKMGGIALKPDIVTSRREETNGQIWLDLSHNGYEEGFGLIHRRRLYLSANGEDFMGEDQLVGKGGNSFALRFHLHPAVQVSITQNGQAALMKLAKGSFWRMRVQGGELALAESAAIGAGGRVRRTQQLVIMGAIENDRTEVKWLIQREGGRR